MDFSARSASHFSCNLRHFQASDRTVRVSADDAAVKRLHAAGGCFTPNSCLASHLSPITQLAFTVWQDNIDFEFWLVLVRLLAASALIQTQTGL